MITRISLQTAPKLARDGVFDSRKLDHVSRALTTQSGEREGNKQTVMPTLVQKNYTIYIYIYIQYINLFLLNPNETLLPPTKKPYKLSVADPKTYNKRENKQSFFPFLFPLWY